MKKTPKNVPPPTYPPATTGAKSLERPDDEPTPLDEDDAGDPGETPTDKEHRAARKAIKAAAGERTREQSREALRRAVRFFYDCQKLRIAIAHRTRTDVLPEGEENPTEPPPKGTMSRIELHQADQTALDLRARQIGSTEKGVLGDIKALLATMPFYVKVLSDKARWRGLGPTMAAVILSEFDIQKADTVSKMWSFAGLAPVPAWRCSSLREMVASVSSRPMTDRTCNVVCIQYPLVQPSCCGRRW